jgi:hypothetical protein
MKPPARIVPQLLKLDRKGRLIWQHRSREWFASDGSQKSWCTKHAVKPALTYTSKRGQRQGSLLGRNVYARAVLHALAMNRAHSMRKELFQLQYRHGTKPSPLKRVPLSPPVGHAVQLHGYASTLGVDEDRTAFVPLLSATACPPPCRFTTTTKLKSAPWTA